jgi:squalene synthase HpnC
VQQTIPNVAAELGWRALPSEYRIPDRPASRESALEYCERLARRHYENFSVATWFLPAPLRQHFYNVYAYCRISDDLGDEVGNAEQSLALLGLWEAELNACYEGTPRHPVFVALRETVREFDIPKHEFADLLTAFRQDQTVTRFPAFDDVLAYCKYSANPVGHLVLYLGGYRDAERQRLSDYTCTALQLANFWQDIRIDYGKGRIYLPQDAMARFGVTEQDIANGRATPQFLELMRFEVQRAREWFERGLPLVKMVSPELALDIELFSRGGQEILNAIERQGFDVLKSRPAISKTKKIWLVVRAGLKKGRLL